MDDRIHVGVVILREDGERWFSVDGKAVHHERNCLSATSECCTKEDAKEKQDHQGCTVTWKWYKRKYTIYSGL